MKIDAYVIETAIPTVTNAKEAAETVRRLLEPVDIARAEELCDLFGINGYQGEHGDGGQTYYPKGTNVEDNYLEYYTEYNDIEVTEDGNLVEGVWVSSSELC